MHKIVYPRQKHVQRKTDTELDLYHPIKRSSNQVEKGLVTDMFSVEYLKQKDMKETFGWISPEGRSDRNLTWSVKVDIRQHVDGEFMSTR